MDCVLTANHEQGSVADRERASSKAGKGNTKIDGTPIIGRGIYL